MTAAPYVDYHAVEQNVAQPCPACGVPVIYFIDKYGLCQQRGGCPHIAVIEQYDGSLRVGFFCANTSKGTI